MHFLVTKILYFIKAGIKIRRGLKEKHKESDSEEKLPEITHLVFVIHGIAQKLYENSVIKNCEEYSID